MSDVGVTVKISSRIEIGEMRKVEEALQRQIVRMRMAGAAATELAAKEKELIAIRSKLHAEPAGKKWGAAFSELAHEIPGVTSLMDAAGGHLGALGVGVLGVVKSFELGLDAVKAFAAGQVEMAKLDAALANSGQLTEHYREKLEKLASSRSQATGIDGEQYVGMFTTLTKFGADDTNIEKYTHAVENLAGFLGGDFAQASFIFGKAMQGHTEMLGRYGISVDKSKGQTAALADIMRQLEARGGGQLEAMGNTMQGAFKKVGNAWEELLKSMGSYAESSGITDLMNNWSAGARRIAEYLKSGSESKSENREIFIANKPEDQGKTNGLANAKRGINAEIERLEKEKALEKSKIEAASEFGSSFDEVGKSNAQKKLEDIEKQIEYQKSLQPHIDQEMKKLGVTAITPQEDAKRREEEAFAKDRDKGIADVEKAAAQAAMKPKDRLAAMEGDLATSKSEMDDAKDLDLKKEKLKEYLTLLGKVEAQKAANAESDKADAASARENELARENLDLELQMNEAKATGNDKEAERIKWTMDYNRILKQRMALGEDEATAAGEASRGASIAGIKDSPHSAAVSDRLSQIGGYNGGGGPAANAERHAATTAKFTEKLASIVGDIEKKFAPRSNTQPSSF